jgi:sugar transferase (PEP-CTERM/EpsH1 system associated)
VRELSERIQFDAAIAYALPMFPYAPPGVPVVFDMQDVDSEKWLSYAQMKRFGFLYEIEAGRLRRYEIAFARQAEITLLTARQETELFRRLAPGATVECMENGVDFSYFDPMRVMPLPELAGRRFVVFVGTMDYFPNIDAACWFADEVFPRLRAADHNIEFFVVGSNPSKPVLNLGTREGVVVTGSVADVRPYIAQATAVVAPLRLARGIQNKVLEALVMGRPVFSTTPVCNTFGSEVPSAIIRCDSAEDFVRALRPHLDRSPAHDQSIRDSMRGRFQWETNVQTVVHHLEAVSSGGRVAAVV